MRASNSIQEAQNKREPADRVIATDENSIPKSSLTGIIDEYDLYDDPLPSETDGTMSSGISLSISSFFSFCSQSEKNEEIIAKMSSNSPTSF